MRPVVQQARRVCPVEVAVAVLGGSWKLSIVNALLEHGTLRTSALRRELTGVSERTLTRQLRELEIDGILARTVHPEVPPRVEYSVTELGLTLEDIVEAMNTWGRRIEERLES
ncbi:winged helix-turn-helix transcriptional regulator [Brachybacterium sacelli]|uniref:DNA-binding HxlR family transcriptional regulator n=1 Tax=Brachybacterium sacelli TaxID=173364 RepID=A0ABS4WY62_9MICO|nr:helix-turn-helix domain-containing protein [Brachybacterium sacelli]MBP2381140.1 DNA-binding HxlR family transcriptional regulator [Brachybacterium sacelli]